LKKSILVSRCRNLGKRSVRISGIKKSGLKNLLKKVQQKYKNKGSRVRFKKTLSTHYPKWWPMKMPKMELGQTVENWKLAVTPNCRK
jgi:hypothetical protein